MTDKLSLNDVLGSAASDDVYRNFVMELQHAKNVSRIEFTSFRNDVLSEIAKIQGALQEAVESIDAYTWTNFLEGKVEKLEQDVEEYEKKF